MRLFIYHPDNMTPEEKEQEKKVFRYSLVVPSLFTIAFWMIKVIEEVMKLSFVKGGIFPLHTKGLLGIITSPFIHSGFEHLFSNTLPFFILSTALFFFYRKLAYRIFFMIYVLSGICVWLGAREAWHIGASGVVYGLAAFVFFSGVFRKQMRLLTVAIIVVFLYGGMFWGIFPIKPGISWESHLWGAMSGLILSIVYRHQGPTRKKYDWENEEDEEDSEYEVKYWLTDKDVNPYDNNSIE